MQGISFNTRTIPDPDLVAFIEANGIDHTTVPVDQVAKIHGGKLTVEVFVRGDDGRFLIDGTKKRYVREERTVPLLSTPETHNLRSL